MSEEHNYSVVSFSDATFPKQYKNLNIVPSAWIVHAKNDAHKLLCPFPTTKSTKSNVQVLNNLVKKLKPPSGKWKQYHVEVRERTLTYEEATKKLKQLEEEEGNISTKDPKTQPKPDERTGEKKPLKKSSRKNKTFKSSLPASIDLTSEGVEQSIAQIVKSTGESSSGTRTSNNSSQDTASSTREIESNKSPNDEVDYVDENPMVVDHAIENNNLTTNDETIAETSNSEVTLATLHRDVKNLSAVTVEGIKKLSSLHSTLRSEVVSLKIQLQTIKTRGLKRPATNEYHHIKDLVLPFESAEAFREFDTKLESSKAMQQEVGDKMWSSIELNDLMKTMTSIFKKFFTGQVLSKYTAKNPVEGKAIFEKTELYKCIHGQINQVWKKASKNPVTTAALTKIVGKVINNSKDWGGERKKKKQKTTATNVENAGETGDDAVGSNNASDAASGFNDAIAVEVNDSASDSGTSDSEDQNSASGSDASDNE